MNRLERLIAHRPFPRPRVVVAAALVTAALAVPSSPAPASAGWAPETAVAGIASTRPALAMDASGTLGVAWQEVSETPGILFATDASGTWATTRVSSGDDWAPDLAFGPAGVAHVAYLRFGTGAGLYYATNATGSWVSTLLRADAEGWSPAVAVDGKGKVHIAYASSGFTPGIYHYTNATGAWVGSRVTTSTWDSEPTIAIDGADTIRVAFARYEPTSPGIYLRSRAATGTTWSEVRVSSGGMVDDYPALGIDAAGKLHVAFLRYDADWYATLSYATNAAGSWVRSSIAMPGSVEPGIPSLGFDTGGAPEIIAGVFGDDDVDTLYRFGGPGLASAEALLPPATRSSDFPDVLRDEAGRLTVAYRNSWHAPGLFLHREDPDEETTIAASTYLWAPVIQGRDDRRYLVVDRFTPDGSDGTTLAVKDAGTWTDTVVDPVEHGAPDLQVVSSASGDDVYVSNPHRLLRNEGAGWLKEDLALRGYEASLAIDFDPTLGIYPVVAYSSDGGIRARYEGIESAVTTDLRDWNPDLAADIWHDQGQALAFMRDDDLYVTGTTGELALDLVSDPTWLVADANPTVGPALSLPGPAQRVCLNDASPPECPEDAVRYGHSGFWYADLSSIPGASWVWAPGITGASTPADGDAYTFTRTFSLPALPSAATVKVAADDTAEVRVNGQLVGTASGAGALTTFDIKAPLVAGPNTIVVTGANGVVCGSACTYASNPGAVVIGASITFAGGGAVPPGARPTWATPKLVDSTSAWDPAVTFSWKSGMFLAYDRHAAEPGIYLARAATATGTWTSTRLSRSWADSAPVILATESVEFDGDRVYVAWVRGCSGAAPGIYLARNGPGWSWSVERVVDSCDVGDVSLDVAAGKVVLAYRVGTARVVATTETTSAAASGGAGPAVGIRSARALDAIDEDEATVVGRVPAWRPAATDGAPARSGGRPGGGGRVPATP